jgi:hypothetical protein
MDGFFGDESTVGAVYGVGFVWEIYIISVTIA